MSDTLRAQVVSSVYNDNAEVLQAILTLHVGSTRFDVDPCYSKGMFYRDGRVRQPRYKFDLYPQFPTVQKADCREIPLPSRSVNSVVFDPPFMFGRHGKTDENIMTKRFTMFDSFAQLRDVYQGALREFARILVPGGIVAFKCQDYTDSRTTMTHCLVWLWAKRIGFYPKDLFILVASGGRVWNPTLVQRHARKFHSYYWVLVNRSV